MSTRRRRAFDAGLTKRTVCGDAAAEQEALRPGAPDGLRGLRGDHVDDRVLEGGGNLGHDVSVRATLGRRIHVELFGLVEDGGLEAGEAEIESTAEPRARELERGRDALRDALDGGAAGETESEEACGFIESLARGIVAGAAQQLVVAMTSHQDEVRVGARSDEDDEGKAGVCRRIVVLRAMRRRCGLPDDARRREADRAHRPEPSRC